MITFLEETHTYLHDGVVIPSVSEFLKWLFPNKYKGIDKEVLQRKADYGTLVHKAIECLENGEPLPKLSYIQEASINQYLKLKEKYNFKVKEQEIIVTNGKLAGRLDMIFKIDNTQCLGDIKTTVELDRNYLSWQLSLYDYLYNYYVNDFNEYEFEKYYCIWLPKKELGQFVEIEKISVKEVEKKLKEFIKENEMEDLFK